MSALQWTAAGFAAVGIVALTIWAAAEAARSEGQTMSCVPPTPPGEALREISKVCQLIVLFLWIVVLHFVHTRVGRWGAGTELRLRRLGALVDGDDTTILDDHGHPWDPNNSDWKDPWSTT